MLHICPAGPSNTHLVISGCLSPTVHLVTTRPMKKFALSTNYQLHCKKFTPLFFFLFLPLHKFIFFHLLSSLMFLISAASKGVSAFSLVMCQLLFTSVFLDNFPGITSGLVPEDGSKSLSVISTFDLRSRLNNSL